MNKAQVGKRGEQAAAAYLRRHGYEIADRNVHVSHQEIDVIALNRECIAFVEVKTRISDPTHADRYSTPAAAVTAQKQKYLITAAKRYIADHGYSLQPRMDVIEVYLAPEQQVSSVWRVWERITGLFGTPQRKVLHINHIENAFGPNGYRP